MHLSTKVIAKKSEQLNRSLMCSFDHPFHFLEDNCGSHLPHHYPVSIASEAEKTSPSAVLFQSHCSSLSQRQLESLLINTVQTEIKSKERSICFVIFNIPFLYEYSSKILQKLGQGWKSLLYEYSSRLGTIKEIPLQGESKNFESTIILELVKNEKQSIKMYFLPVTAANHPISNSQVIQESFKLFRVIKSYLSLVPQIEGIAYLEDLICVDLSEYLYMKNVSNINFLFNFSGDQIDNRILRKLGEIKSPQQSLDKPQYRQIKQEIYCLHREEWQLIRGLKNSKTEVLKQINEIRGLTGLKDVKYQDVNLQHLKKLKTEGLNQKVVQLKQLQNVRADLDIRYDQLQKRKSQCASLRTQLQKNHGNQMLNLKKDVLSLQAEEPTPKYSGTQRFIYNRSKPSVQKKLITTIFSQANNLIKPDTLPDERLSFKIQNNDKTNRYQSQLEKQNNKKTNDFKFAEKKYANVVKEVKDHQNLDSDKIREEYQNLLINVDFQAEKKLLAQQIRYQKATAALKRFIEANENLSIE